LICVQQRCAISSDALLRLFLLGAFRIERDSRTLQLPTRKVESLLAYLALHPEQHPREKLAALLWGDSTDEQARHSLRTALATLRKPLGDNVILADRETVQLNPDLPLWVDAREFQTDIDLYRGDLLVDFYDEWILPEREHYRAVPPRVRRLKTKQSNASMTDNSTSNNLPLQLTSFIIQCGLGGGPRDDTGASD
jgi:DNA-binding SARP family transcriptional activator